MCSVCGCSEGETKIGGKPASHSHQHDHHHDHSHEHDHDHGNHHHEEGLHHYGHGEAGAAVAGMSQTRLVQIEQDILSKNNAHANGNRGYFQENGILALNLVSSPGSGKTSLLCKTIEMLGDEIPVAVVEGDQQTNADADRIRATGAPAIQINTGKGCHLDGHMIGHAVEDLKPEAGSALFIENVGNLVCPAAFDLGEQSKVLVLSVTEGEDKPLKYPDMFAASDLVIFNKIDLLPYLDFDMEAAVANARRVNPGVKIMKVSARTGEGMESWLAWIRAARAMQIAGNEKLAGMV